MRAKVNGKEQRHKEPPNTAPSIVKAVRTRAFRKRFPVLRGERMANITLTITDKQTVLHKVACKS
jgi:hypothetical protein